MNIIEQGLHLRSVDVFEIAHEQVEVQTAENDFWDCYNKVVELYGHSELLGDLETCVVNMEMSASHASYRLGIADGMALQQEINSMTKGGSANEQTNPQYRLRSL